MEPLRYDGAQERRNLILTALRTTGFVATADLTRQLGVSDMTVRRDLRKLEKSGEVRTVRGGVSFPHGTLQSSGFAGRASANADAKRSIARSGRDLVGVDDTVAIDAGTTAHELAGALGEEFAGCVVTHSVPVIQLMLGRATARVVGIGGDLYAASQAFIGPMSVDAASQLRVRTFFLGAAAVDERGVYVAADAERPTKLALMDIADEVVLLADHTKFATSAPVLLGPLDRLSALVTEQPPPPRVAERLAAAGTRLIVAEG